MLVSAPVVFIPLIQTPKIVVIEVVALTPSASAAEGMDIWLVIARMTTDPPEVRIEGTEIKEEEETVPVAITAISTVI